MQSIESVCGLSRLTSVIGDPIARVRSPGLVNRMLEQQQRENVLMIPMHVSSRGLPELLTGLRHCQNFAGAIIAQPHQQSVYEWLDKVSPAVQMTGTCNVIRRSPDGTLSGTLLEGDGFIAGLRQQGIDVAGKRVYLAGAGFSASAIAHALAGQGVTELILYNRTEEKGVQLAESLSKHHPGLVVIHGTERPAHCDIAINATAAGKGEDRQQAFSLAGLAAGTLVCDTVIYPQMTPLLHAAEGAGMQTHHGEYTLMAQLALMISYMLDPLNSDVQ